MILPNGKRLWYWHPRLKETWPLEHKTHTGNCQCQPRLQVHYMAQKTGQWHEVHTYGGKLAENAIQAISREIMMPAAVRLEEAGYPVILTVYDEVICEVPIGHGSQEEFLSLMLNPLPDWAATWPINATMWVGERYKKE